MSLRALARAYHNNPQAIGNGRTEQPIMAPWVKSLDSVATSSSMDHRYHLIMHPTITPADTDGRGYYLYPRNPDIMRGFMYHPLRRVDFLSTRTGSSNIATPTVQEWEDVIVQEIWLADANRTSVLSEMFRVLHEYYVRTPPVGRYVGWCPFSRSWGRYNVQIVSVDLGPPEYEYNDVKTHLSSFVKGDPAQINQLTLSLKLVRRAVPPRGEITFEGA